MALSFLLGFLQRSLCILNLDEEHQVIPVVGKYIAKRKEKKLQWITAKEAQWLQSKRNR